MFLKLLCWLIWEPELNSSLIQINWFDFNILGMNASGSKSALGNNSTYGYLYHSESANEKKTNMEIADSTSWLNLLADKRFHDTGERPFITNYTPRYDGKYI